MHKEADAVVKKATAEELKTLIPDPVKGTMLVDILRWAMHQGDSNDAGQRAGWAKYMGYRADQDQPSASVSSAVIVLESEEEEAVEVMVRAPEPGHCSMPIVLDDDEDEETVHATVEPEDNYKAMGPRHSKRLHGRHG
jgi:hypothetical protein